MSCLAPCDCPPCKLHHKETVEAATIAERERCVEVAEGAMLWNMGVSAKAVQARMVCRAIAKEIREPSAHDESRKA